MVPGPVPAQLNLKFEHEDDVVESFKPTRNRGTLDLKTLQEKLSSFIEAYCSVTPTAKTLSPAGRHGLKTVKGSRDRTDENLIRPDPATHGRRMRLSVRTLSSERFNPASTSPEQSSYERFLHRLGLKVKPKHPADAIDQMIVACNPRCLHCDEGESDCVCAEYVFAGEKGKFEPMFSSDFDFDTVMSQISGAYSPQK